MATEIINGEELSTGPDPYAHISIHAQNGQLEQFTAADITITRVAGQFRVLDPIDGVFEFRGSRAGANTLKDSWVKKHKLNQVATNFKGGEGKPSKSTMIRDMVDEMMSVRDIAKKTGLRYQMCYNVAMTYLKGKSEDFRVKYSATFTASTEEARLTSGEPDEGTEPIE